MKKIAALMCILALTVQLTACGSKEAAEAPQTPEVQEPRENTETEDETGASAGDVKFATIMVTNNDWAMKLAEGGEEACAKYGYEHIVMNSENDIQKQTDLVQS